MIIDNSLAVDTQYIRVGDILNVIKDGISYYVLVTEDPFNTSFPIRLLILETGRVLDGYRELQQLKNKVIVRSIFRGNNVRLVLENGGK